MSNKKKSEGNLSLEEKLKVLEELNVFHNNPKKNNSKITNKYKNKNFKFEIEFFEGVRLLQVDMDKHEIPVEYIWGTPKRKSYIEALHEALDKCISEHQKLNTPSKKKPSKKEKNSPELLPSPEDLDLEE